MAASLLIDLDSIDLTQTYADSDAICRVNPQGGPMQQIDRIIWHDEAITQGVGIKYVRDDEFWVPYHVPGRPLMPGVLMIEAAAQLGSYLYRSKIPNLGFVGFTRCTDTAFRGQVVPGDELLVLCKEVESTKRRFVSMFQGVVAGRLVMETTITGMVF